MPTHLQIKVRNVKGKEYDQVYVHVQLQNEDLQNYVCLSLCACRPCGVIASYISVPRINFAGLYRADILTANNDFSNFAYAAGYTDHDFLPGWNAQGSGEFSLINCTVRSVTYLNGSTSQSDPVVGSTVVTNPRSSPAKLIYSDLDPAFLDIIFGMELALLWGSSNTLAFVGTSAPFLIDQDEWTNIPCAPADKWFLSRLSAHSVTVLQNVTWSTDGSEILQQMQAGGRELSVALTLYSHCPIDVPTEQLTSCENTGYVVGTIGVIQSTSSPAAFSSFGSHRIMTFNGVEQPEISWPPEDACSDPQQVTQGVLWMYKAPFDIDATKKAARVVFGSAFSKNADGVTLKDFGSELSLAILDEQPSDHCVHVLADGAIPYRVPGWFENSAGMFDATLTDEELELLVDKPLVVVRLVPSGANKSVTEYPPCVNSSRENPQYQLMLRESPYFVRPRYTYVYRMEAGDSVNTSLYVTHFGQPSTNTTVILKLESPVEGTPTSDGVAPLQQEGMTDEHGFVHFTFESKSYKHLPHCGVPFQAYKFIYRIKEDTSNCFTSFLHSAYYTCINPITFLLWKDDREMFKPPYSWQEHVGPIFKQYAILYPIMRSILNLSNFTDVTQPKNIRLIRYSMTLDLNHPSYMPSTRDLSPTKQAAILEWLDDPLYESPISLLSSDIVALCSASVFFHSTSKDTATCSSASFALHPHFVECAHFDWSANPSALAEWQKDALLGSCTQTGLRRQLQQAIELEFATIPLYLTALFSIKEGYNREVYSIIRTVVLQEMLHLAQAANLLIAFGGHPQIDSKMAAPRYPSKGLPGNVLPNLNVTLRRASREHIYEVFMALEHPHHFAMANSTTRSSIGDFYDQILKCMEHLQSKREIKFRNSRSKRQIEWPWEENDYGQLHVVSSLGDARAAISAIREQAEGSSPVDPTYSDSHDLAHFFLFEQVVCGRRLIYDQPSNRYSFIGEPVELDPKGVWPMRDHPSKVGLTPGTRPYTVARAFHQQYRSLLRQLQAVFDGNSGGIKDAVATMETLTAFGKRAAAEKMHPDMCDSETVGPVWDYEWEY